MLKKIQVTVVDGADEQTTAEERDTTVGAIRAKFGIPSANTVEMQSQVETVIRTVSDSDKITGDCTLLFTAPRATKG